MRDNSKVDTSKEDMTFLHVFFRHEYFPPKSMQFNIVAMILSITSN